jgi:23S rRNA (adenine-N6)-dimethyltransferase
VAGSRLRWGWHELDDGWARRLVDVAGVGRGDLVLDIGAGTGRLTARLVARGARVVAFELHAGRAAALRRRFEDVRVVQADASDLRLPGRPFAVVANPPFAITSSLVRRLTCRSSRLSVAVLVVPSWAASRWAGRRGAFDLVAGPSVPATAFRPAAPAAARVLVIRRRVLR